MDDYDFTALPASSWKDNCKNSHSMDGEAEERDHGNISASQP